MTGSTRAPGVGIGSTRSRESPSSRPPVRRGTRAPWLLAAVGAAATAAAAPSARVPLAAAAAGAAIAAPAAAWLAARWLAGHEPGTAAVRPPRAALAVAYAALAWRVGPGAELAAVLLAATGVAAIALVDRRARRIPTAHVVAIASGRTRRSSSLGLVTVSAPTLEELDAAARRIQQTARARGLGLRVLHGRQDVAWGATLPFGLAEPRLLDIVGI